MRDLLLCMLVFGALPFVLRWPFLGVLLWTWLGLMNPHRFLWGFGLGLPFAQVVFLATVAGLLLAREPWKVPMKAEVWLLVLFGLWMLFTTRFALFPSVADVQWQKVWRVLLGTLLTLQLATSQRRLLWLAGVAAASLGFYGVKGGVFTLLSAGADRVFGPPLSFIADNNDLGLALLMTLPLLWFFAQSAPRRWQRHALLAAVALTLVAIVGTQSRGALVGLCVMGLLLFLKSRNRLVPLLVAIGFGSVLPLVAPAAWFDRMATILAWREDNSALGRLDSWRNALAIANERLTGGGFQYLPQVGRHDAHSIYFQVLGEHGWPGLLLFVAALACAWHRAGVVRRRARKDPQLAWAGDLATMVQVSLAAYLSAGAFLGLAYFDFCYLLIALLIQLDVVSAHQVAPVPTRAVPRVWLSIAPR